MCSLSSCLCLLGALEIALGKWFCKGRIYFEGHYFRIHVQSERRVSRPGVEGECHVTHL